MMGGGPADGHRVSGIVDLGVVVEDSADQARPLESGYRSSAFLRLRWRWRGNFLPRANAMRS